MPDFINKKQLANLENLNTVVKKIDLNLSIAEVEEVVGQSSITIEETPAAFSFKNLDLGREFVQNPNILETQDFDRLKNDKASLEKPFSEITDPIYNFDEARDENQQMLRKNVLKKQKSTKVYKKISAINMKNLKR